MLREGLRSASAGAAALGVLADWTSIDVVLKACVFLPAIGFLAGPLPSLDHQGVPTIPKSLAKQSPLVTIVADGARAYSFLDR